MWSIELVSIDIMTELSCLSKLLFSPREGHLNAVYKIFRYLQKNISKNLGRVAFDPVFVHTDEKLFEGIKKDLEDWKNFYPDAEESHPRKKLGPLVEHVNIWLYVDVNHSGDLANRRSHSGILIYVNNVLINFYSKRQNTV